MNEKLQAFINTLPKDVVASITSKKDGGVLRQLQAAGIDVPEAVLKDMDAYNKKVTEHEYVMDSMCRFMDRKVDDARKTSTFETDPSTGHTRVTAKAPSLPTGTSNGSSSDIGNEDGDIWVRPYMRSGIKVKGYWRTRPGRK